MKYTVLLFTVAVIFSNQCIAEDEHQLDIQLPVIGNETGPVTFSKKGLRKWVTEDTYIGFQNQKEMGAGLTLGHQFDNDAAAWVGIPFKQDAHIMFGFSMSF